VKLSTIGWCGLAYVLGARAGRERYEQIRKLAQETAHKLESYGEDGSLAVRVTDWLDQAQPPPRRG
jgi:hypothetical protein